MNAIAVFDFAGMALFAATGALAASRKQLDIVGFLFLAGVTGIGGGTARDLILGVPVFWVEQPLYLVVCAATAVALYFTAHLAESRYRWLLWLDAVALAAYAVFGAHKGLQVSGSAAVAIVMGMLTGTLGGILRDVLSNEPSVLLRKEIYVFAAMIAGAVFVAAGAAGAPVPVAAGLGFGCAVLVRAGAIALSWSLPVYRSRPGRDPRRPR